MSRREPSKIASIANPIPLDMIHAWLRGEYRIGQNDSTGYEFLGWALMLRGAYVYAVIPFNEDGKEGECKKENLSHWGICTIDIEDGDLTYQGVRLNVNKNDISVTNKQIWYSLFSKLTRFPSSSDNMPDAFFAYIMDNIEDPSELEIGNLLKGAAYETPSNQSFPFEKIVSQEGDNKAIYFKLDEKVFDKETKAEFLNYLSGEGFENDRRMCCKNDEIVAIAQIRLENWKEGSKKIANVQPIVSKSGNPEDQIPCQGKVYFCPLME